MTINPYASFWLIPIWIGMVSSASSMVLAILFGIIVGGAHGAGRVLGIWQNERQQNEDSSPKTTFMIMTRFHSWRLIDGRLLLAASGTLIVFLAMNLRLL
jgi:hypothetical protein